MARKYTIESSSPSGQGGSIDYRSELNDQQYAAVTSLLGPSLVIAGAGSGKTRTLTYRVAYLLDNGIPPENILLLTFTNKAAREMLDRVGDLVPHETRSIWGGTFHSIGNRLLRRHAEKVGLTNSFSIMDREDQKDLMAVSIAAAGVNTKEVRFPKPEVLANMFSLSDNTGIELQEIIEARYPYFEELHESISSVRKAYCERKLATNSADFDDLLVLSLRLLEENPEIAGYYQSQFQFVLVDEYQDTNWVQSQFIDNCAAKHGNLMVVGDDAQSIYSWRGADFEHILEFSDTYPKAKTFKIETNYRSVPEVLELANHSIKANTKQYEKNLRAHRPARGELPALIALNDPSTQACFVAQRVLELRDEGIELEEMAVLYRAHFQAMELQMELTNRGIPFNITSGLRFFEQAHVKDVAAFMKLAVNRRDEVAFKRIARMLPGIGTVSADKLWGQWRASPLADANTHPRSFTEHIEGFKIPGKARSSWSQLGYTLDELLDGEQLASPQDMIKSVMGGVYDDYMRSKFPNYDNRIQDLDQLKGYSAQFDDVSEFLGQLALLAGVDGGPESGGQRKDLSEALTLSSVHQAKGLEWRVVFVIWLTEGMFPNARVIEEDDDEQSGLEEERRLFYVAVTRAKDELYLSYPYMWPNSRTGDIMQRPSRFLDDFPDELVEQWDVGSAGASW
ncbi:MAG: UvrD-helicase domain-containing protein [Verrucomicrobiaceae bacterium]|nr:UvrD-helicase domain-containing protein [Verrucomicrobiaceae bacterium]